ncbi:MAG: 2-oxoacid:acceptor oxidoreductase family protein [Firmicutes bacterium]|nr:2-oxoacid:acceptor oxidoreductase family protein [Bacillota bacterium]
MIEIRWHGRGGQGVVTAAKVLAAAALDQGKHIQAFPEFGPERRGAPIQAFTRIDNNPIKLFSHVTSPHIIVVLDRTLVGKIPFTEGLVKDGTVIVNCRHSAQHLRDEIGLSYGKVFAVDATTIANETIGRPITNTPMLGALIKATEILNIDAVKQELRAFFGAKLSPKAVQANIDALQRAYEEVHGE